MCNCYECRLAGRTDEEEIMPVTLMERECGGVRVELRLCADGRVAITTEQGIETQGMFIPDDKALDAFYHPFYYLAQRDKESV